MPQVDYFLSEPLTRDTRPAPGPAGTMASSDPWVPPDPDGSRREVPPMPHIALHNDAPGITGLFQYRPETARPLRELSEVLLRGPNTLTRGERELIAAHVSTRNHCRFCALSHGASAAAQLPGASDLEIHDTVLIAAAFSMYNRYVDGLATIAPDDPAAYAKMAERIVGTGYLPG